jgi:hypothetical protein
VSPTRGQCRPKGRTSPAVSKVPVRARPSTPLVPHPPAAVVPSLHQANPPHPRIRAGSNATSFMPLSFIHRQCCDALLNHNRLLTSSLHIGSSRFAPISPPTGSLPIPALADSWPLLMGPPRRRPRGCKREDPKCGPPPAGHRPSSSPYDLPCGSAATVAVVMPTFQGSADLLFP